MKPSRHEIALLVERFDFERVAKVMDLLQWTWTHDSKKFIPSTEQLRAEAVKLAGNVEMEIGYGTATGGFAVEVMAGEDGKPYLRLQFVIEESDTEYL